MTRRAEQSAEIAAQTGIGPPMIEALVHAFYDRVRGDSLLAPIFEARIQDWSAHLGQMCAFWSSVALMTGQYHGHPMQKHASLPVSAEHFDRWLALFEETALDLCPPNAAEHFIARAHRMAESLELGIARNRGVFLHRGERLGEPSFRTDSAGEFQG